MESSARDNRTFARITRSNLSQTALLLGLLVLPWIELLLPTELRISGQLRPIFVFAILALGLNVVTGFTGLLNLGIAAFMAIGAYSYSVLSCDVFPFQLGFWLSALGAMIVGALSGLLLGLPTMRLRGDYLAVVTLGFGEIVQDSLRNLEVITKGTQGISPVPGPSVFGYIFPPDVVWPWYYLFLATLAVLCLLIHNVEHSRVGRAWKAIREDELAASCMAVPTVRLKLLAFASSAAIAALAGALWAAMLGSSGEPGNYDFSVSIIALCIVIVGGLGSVKGVLAGALLMVGFNSILLVKLSDFLARNGYVNTQSVFLVPNNWKYLVFGLALILTMRFRPQGIAGK
jgi:branched-chain amino acid transport system permease protein